MNEYISEMKHGDKLRFWEFDHFTTTPYECEKETDHIDLKLSRTYKTMEELGQIVYAVRRAYSREVTGRLAQVTYEHRKMDQIFFPLEGDALELSSFFHKPTIISTCAKTICHSDTQQMAEFLIRNTTYLKVWVNGNLLGVYEPKTRNTEQEQHVLIPLKQGKNEIQVYLEELAERDIYFYVEFCYLGQKPLRSSIPVTAEPSRIDDAIQVLKSFSLEQDMVFEQATIVYDPSLLKDSLEIFWECGEDPLGKTFTDLSASDKPSDTRLLTKNQSSFCVPVRGVGKQRCVFTARVGNVDLHLTLLFNVDDPSLSDIAAENTIEKRKQQALKLITSHGKDFPTTILAIAETTGTLDQRGERLLQEALQTVNEKKDCADFRLLPILVLYQKYRHLLSEPLRLQIKEAVLNFRYWCDEPGNDVMWFFSENHALLFHAGQYLAGILFPDEIFSASGYTGKEQQARGYKKLMEWFDTFELDGYDEWNSVTYIPIDLIGLYSLYLGTSGMIHERTKKALDTTFVIIAGNMYREQYICAYARVYEEYLKGAQLNEMNLISWIIFGQGRFNVNVQASALLCISDYEPAVGHSILNAPDNDGLLIKRKQGALHANTCIYKTLDYALATAIDYLPFTAGIGQSVLNLAIGQKPVTLWINHPGEKSFSGQRRPSYWAGNGTLPRMTQEKNIAMGIYQIAPSHIVDFIHMYVPRNQLEQCRKEGLWLFLKQDTGYAGVWFSNDFTFTTTGANRGKEVISSGRNHGIVVVCGCQREHNSFEEFMKQCSQADVSYDGHDMLQWEDQYERKVLYGKI